MMKSSNGTSKNATDRTLFGNLPSSRGTSLDMQNPIISPSPSSQTKRSLPPILSPKILSSQKMKINLKHSPRDKLNSMMDTINSSSHIEESIVNDQIPPNIKDYLQGKNKIKSPKPFDEKKMQANLIKQKFDQEFKKKFSPFMNYNSLKHIGIGGGKQNSHKKLSRSILLESPDGSKEQNAKILKQHKRQLQEEEEKKRQIKLTEVKMRNNLLKNKDFRKILKNYLKKSKITSTSVGKEYYTDENGKKKMIQKERHANGMIKSKQTDSLSNSFFINKSQNKLMAPVSFSSARQKFQDPDFKFLPPFPISIQVDPSKIQKNRQLTGKVKIGRRSASNDQQRINPITFQKAELAERGLEMGGKISPRGEDIMKNHQIKGILKTGGYLNSRSFNQKSLKNLRLPKVTFKLQQIDKKLNIESEQL